MKDYAMYTDKGNAVADAIVQLAKTSGLEWDETMSIMRFMANRRPDLCGELTDTAVREVIYHRLKFTSEFYI